MTDQQKKKVLIVDDDKFLLGMYAGKFNKAGLEAEVATSGTETLAKLKDGYRPDIIVLDIIMPGMDGLELLQKMKEEKFAEGSIIVMLTNQGGTSDIEKAKSLGVHGYIVKATTIPSEVVDEVLKIVETNKK